MYPAPARHSRGVYAAPVNAGPRVLVLTPDFPPERGGIQILIHRIVQHLKHFRARVVTLDSEGAAAFDCRQSFEVERVRAPAGRRGAIAAINARSLSAAFRYRPDVVLSGHVVVSPGGLAVRRLLGVPVVQYLHADELRARASLSGFAIRRADLNIAVSRYTAGLAVDLGAAERRVRRVPNGVDPPEASPTPRVKSPRPTVVTVSRLTDRFKGHDVLMRAMPLIRARVPDVQWTIVGGGPLRAPLERLAAAVGVADAVHFAGELPDAERDALLARSHVFCMPARLPATGGGGEGFGIAFLEASAQGLPVVAGNVAGALDAVAHEATGLLVEPTDHLAVSEAVSALLLDGERASMMGVAGRRRAASSFSWPSVVAQVESVLLELTARQPLASTQS